MADLALLEEVMLAEAAEEEEEEDQRQRLRVERVFKDRKDFLAENDTYLISRFRLPRHVLIWLCNRLDPQLRRETRRSRALSCQTQVLSTLASLATGTFQREVGDRSGITQPSMSRVMPPVLEAIKSLTEEFIRFPFSEDQQIGIKRDFYAIAGVPNVVGAIDCTHVRIKPITRSSIAKTSIQ